MDSHHRKDLETNELRDWVNRTVHNLKTKPQRLLAVLGVVVLIVGGVVAASYLFGLTGGTQSKLWAQLDMATNSKQLDEIIAAAKDAPPGLVARFYKARMLLTQQGIDLLNAATPEQRQSAAASIEEARKIFQELANQTAKEKGQEFFHREALLHAAMAEETLCGVPKGGNPNDVRGNLDKALELYQQLVRESADSLQGRQAAHRAEEITQKRQQVEAFYVQLAQQFVAKSMMPVNPILVPPSGTPVIPSLPPALTPPTPPTRPVLPPPVTAPAATTPPKR